MAITKLRVGTFTPPLVLRVAQRLGRLSDAGLEVEEVAVVSSPAQFASLEARAFDVVFTSPDNVLAYRFLPDNPLEHLLKVEVLAGVDQGLGLSLWTAPNVSEVANVAGSVVGVDVPQSGFAFVAFALLAREGLAPGQYAVESLGSTPRRAQMLIEGRCAATILNAGNELRAGAQGCHFVSGVTDLGPYLGTVLAALEDVSKSDAQARQRFVEVILATSKDLLSGELDDVGGEVASLALGLSDVEARSHLAVLKDPKNGLILDGRLSLAALRTLVDLRREFRPSEGLDRVEASLRELGDLALFVE
ncbi:MAG TPA: hypothetical protein VMU98_06810 [Acidimicrobiales bacterium]|nr:hypothetical protein [Acidimicrobiales bacterium]